jgi:DNA-binding HxlR family transcriptional regulator
MDAGGMGGANGERTGTRILTLLAAPLNALVLNELARGPRRLVELRCETASPQTTLRARLRELSDVGAIAKRRLHPFPSVREYVLTKGAGTDLRFVATTLEAWLAGAPRKPLRLGSEEARAAVKALVEGWSSTILRALAAGPVTLAEIDAAIESLSCQSLERRLIALRLAGLVEGKRGSDRSTPYEVTEWLRQGTGPLAAAIRWERKHLADVTAPVMPLDAEAGLLLSMPLLSLPAEMSGSCRLGVEFPDGAERRLVGVTVDVEGGRIVSCTTRLESSPAAWATGSPAAWLRGTIEANPNRLDFGGNQRLVLALVDGLNRALFAPPARFGSSPAT